MLVLWAFRTVDVILEVSIFAACLASFCQQIIVTIMGWLRCSQLAFAQMHGQLHGSERQQKYDAKTTRVKNNMHTTKPLSKAPKTTNQNPNPSHVHTSMRTKTELFRRR